MSGGAALPAGMLAARRGERFSAAQQSAKGALVGVETEVGAEVEQGVEQKGAGLVILAGPMEGDGEVGGELGVFGKLCAGEGEVVDRGFGLSEPEQAGGPAGKGVGLFGGAGQAESECPLVGLERVGILTEGAQGEGELGGDFGVMRVTLVERAQGG